MSETARSHINYSAALWQPQEHEISLDLVPDTSDYKSAFPFDDYWHLQLARSLAVALGRHPESVASDAAAMRKLSALAAEVAGELERRAAQQEDSGDG
jgi:hypothetical protein